jgi:AcrR family transcriptional regulator
MPLHDLTVADIIAEAGVSRATFYFYFSSKFAVLNALLAQVTDEIYEVSQPYLNRDEEEPPEHALRRGLEAATAVWSQHRAVLRATAQSWHAVPELQELWLGVFERFTEAFAAEIDRERAAGIAPDGPDSRQLSACLLHATERCLYVAGLRVDRNLPDEESIVGPVLALWEGAIYGPQRSHLSRRLRG